MLQAVEPVTRKYSASASTRHWDRVVVLANRAPIRYESTDGVTRILRSPGGLVTAIEPLIRNHGGTWIGHDACAAVHEQLSGQPLPGLGYGVRHVSLSDDEYRGYYYGFANEGLWPLCHDVGIKPVFRPGDFEAYQIANERFAEAAARETSDESALILVQDYHLALAPRYLRSLGDDEQTIVSFWHIPWPRLRVLRSCPWAADLLEGMLGSDVIGFQTDEDCQNFLCAVDALTDGMADLTQRRITYRDRLILVRSYPVGIERNNDALRQCPSPEACRRLTHQELGIAAGTRIILGVDRLDYTKGINQKLVAIERLLESRPDLLGQITFVQIAEPSREVLPAYQATRTELEATAARVNERFGDGSYRPVILLEQRYSPAAVYRFYRAADVCYVGSLQDGMNLVAKEFVEARDDEQGVLILSECAGAARQLRASLSIDPRDARKSADALARALDMSRIEQTTRMRLLRANVAMYDASWWGRQLMTDAAIHRRR